MKPIKISIIVVMICLVVAFTLSFVACQEEEEVDNTVYCEVTFLDWDGSIIQVTKCEEGTSPLLPPIPTRSDDDDYSYIFSCWSENLDCVTEDMTVVAQYEGTYLPKLIWILISDDDEEEVYAKGFKYDFDYPPVCEEDGYHVVWYTDKTGGQEVTRAIIRGLYMDNDRYFYGRWEEIVEEEE